MTAACFLQLAHIDRFVKMSPSLCYLNGFAYFVQFGFGGIFDAASKVPRGQDLQRYRTIDVTHFRHTATIFPSRSSTSRPISFATLRTMVK